MMSSRVTSSGAQRAREQIAIRALRVTHADVAEAVEHAEPREDAVGSDEVVDEGGEGGHGMLDSLRGGS